MLIGIDCAHIVCYYVCMFCVKIEFQIVRTYHRISTINSNVGYTINVNSLNISLCLLQTCNELRFYQCRFPVARIFRPFSSLLIFYFALSFSLLLSFSLSLFLSSLHTLLLSFLCFLAHRLTHTFPMAIIRRIDSIITCTYRITFCGSDTYQ